ncbi:hypothetical protein H2248_003280 [Termitomyces sp. 'cryptogamus']|nr:hypothetical protein H2248_003280 [Termitomyces sp. 'cryptogamus']
MLVPLQRLNSDDDRREKSKSKANGKPNGKSKSKTFDVWHDHMIAPRPLFDASPRLQLPSSPYVRWDALHFLAIAEAGYKYENPSSSISSVSSPYIWPIVLLAVAADSARILHRLTCLHFPASTAIARLVVLLSLFPSSPATLYLAPYAEPFFIYLSSRAKYWDVGFLRHWTPAQIPNFVIAAPPLVLLIAFSVQHIKSSFLGFRARFNGVKETDREENLFATPSITSSLIHSLVMCITLIFFSHTQIVLRLAAALPALYWAVGWLLVCGSPWAKIWIWWSVLWGLISLGLWTAFPPPA